MRKSHCGSVGIACSIDKWASRPASRDTLRSFHKQQRKHGNCQPKYRWRIDKITWSRREATTHCSSATSVHANSSTSAWHGKRIDQWPRSSFATWCRARSSLLWCATPRSACSVITFTSWRRHLLPSRRSTFTDASLNRSTGGIGVARAFRYKSACLVRLLNCHQCLRAAMRSAGKAMWCVHTSG